MRKIPEVQKLKERLIKLPETEAERVHDWLTAVLDVRREDRKRQESSKQENQK